MMILMILVIFKYRQWNRRLQKLNIFPKWEDIDHFCLCIMKYFFIGVWNKRNECPGHMNTGYWDLILLLW